MGIALLLLALGCARGEDGRPGGAGSDGAQGPPGPPGPPGDGVGSTSSVYGVDEVAPLLRVSILELSGASGAGGVFHVGDTLGVRFTLEKEDQSTWLPQELSSSLALVSGPTFNYQRVLGEERELLTQVQANADGSYSLEFPSPLPATYLPPYNDSTSFGADEGELAGQPLLGGTYTLGLSFSWTYTVEGQAFVRVGEATQDFLLGDGIELEPRELTRQENCDRCHVELQAHAGRYRELTLCLLCHTAGAEDRNDPELGAGTPDVSVDSRLLFHRIHSGKHLPSVLGVGTQADGSRDYARAPRPLVFATSAGELRDFSRVGMPVWPERSLPMPRDTGYSALAAEEQALEDALRTGISSCFVCHGDPDDDGPLEAPAQGELINVLTSRKVCGACHDDVDWERDYSANFQTMPEQPDDSQCLFCHEPIGGPLSVADGHVHPLRMPSFDTGLEIRLDSAVEGRGGNGNGVLETGEGVALTFELLDDLGADVDPASLSALEAVLSGPTSNPNLVLSVPIPTGLLLGPQPFTIDLPSVRRLEFVGDSTSASGESFFSEAAPHLAISDAPTLVRVRSATSGGATALTAATSEPQNFLDVVDASGFARDDYLVVDDSVLTREEYAQVLLVEGQRLWTTPIALHAAGASVLEVVLETREQDTDYLLNAAAGSITELGDLGPGRAVVLDYWTPFRLPASYPLTWNASPDLGASSGKWSGESLVAGVYRVGLLGHLEAVWNVAGEDNLYPIPSTPAVADLLVGSAASEQVAAPIDSGESCLACHQELLFHERYQGYESCALCHASAGAEDLPPYLAGNAPATPARTVSFRRLLHRLHRGAELAAADDYLVVGAGAAPYPDNFVTRSFGGILFPALPGRTSRCAKCHGAENEAWFQPLPRAHPDAPDEPTSDWTLSCSACHDANEELAHVQANSAPSGAESCAICHGPGEPWHVERMHRTR